MSYMYLPYPNPPSQVTSPVTQPQQSQSQQSQQPLTPPQQQTSQDLPQELSSPTSPLPLSLHPSSAAVSVSSASPISVNSTGATLSGHSHPTINTAILPPYGGMLPSPQHSSLATPTVGSLLPGTPPQLPQLGDLETILATYGNQPELLKLIIASKTEEDRRRAEEARYRMLDLVVQGENRGLLMTDYDSFLNPPVPGAPTAGTPPSSINSPSIASTPVPVPVTSAPATTVAATATAAATTSLGLNQSGKRFIDDAVDPYPGASTGNNSGGLSNFQDHGLARKRSVTFARDVHHGHLRSQSMSSMPTVSSLMSPGDQFGISMMGLGTSSAGLQHPQHPHSQHPHQPPQHPHSQAQHSPLHQLPPLTLNHSYQQSPQNQHFQSPVQQSPHQQLPPQYPQVFHNMPQFHPHLIRRTNSLSHIPHFPTQHQNGVDRYRRNESESEDESEEENHAFMNDSRPGSALSTYNMVGGTQETSLTMGFADMTSLTGHSSPYSHQQQQSDPDTTTGSNSILSPLRTSSVVAIPTVGSGSRISANSGAGATAGGSAQSSSSAASGADQKRKRKRREMQPVSKTIESLEPYQDNYLWKNNGNTTQKKTGCKSIYYKCSNSAGGCTVNKTVTAKEGGGYTTKYRGEHREDCKKQMRPQLSAQSVSISQHTYALQGAQ